MAKPLKRGDRAAWRSSGGSSVGRLERKLTSPGKIKDHKIAASEGNPEYLVRSAKSGELAVHKPSALRRVKSIPALSHPPKSPPRQGRVWS